MDSYGLVRTEGASGFLFFTFTSPLVLQHMVGSALLVGGVDQFRFVVAGTETGGVFQAHQQVFHDPLATCPLAGPGIGVGPFDLSVKLFGDGASENLQGWGAGVWTGTTDIEPGKYGLFPGWYVTSSRVEPG